MSLWSLISAFLPWVGLATLFAAIYYAKKAGANKEEIIFWKGRCTDLKQQIAVSGARYEQALDTIKKMTSDYADMERKRDEAAKVASEAQAAAADLARKVAENPDAEEAAREAAKDIQNHLLSEAVVSIIRNEQRPGGLLHGTP